MSRKLPPPPGNLTWALSRPPVSPHIPITVSQDPSSIEDDDLVAQVVAAYQKAASTSLPSDDGWNAWSGTLKAPVHNALLAGGDAAQAMLRHPEHNTHFWGFDSICKAPPGAVEPHENVFRSIDAERDWKASYSFWLHDTLYSLAEAVGASRVYYPETEPGLHYRIHGDPISVDDILDRIEVAIEIPLDFPNPFAGEAGLGTRRGVVSFRALQAIYQAWRIKQIVRGRRGARVVEIGAGLGRTAYYANKFGLRDYTIIDIPLTGAAQGYFLGRTLGADAITFSERQGASWQVKIVSPECLSGLPGRYDVVVNVDSFTELSPSITQIYWNFARSKSDYLLSINHELNPNIVQNMYKSTPNNLVSRHPYWMRRGYVEELFDFRR